MKIEVDNDKYNFKYTYKLEKGISSIKGGFKVLKDLQYPDSLLKSILDISNKLD